MGCVGCDLTLSPAFLSSTMCLFVFFFVNATLRDPTATKKGMVDVLVASRGRHFMGCWFSTFTGYSTFVRVRLFLCFSLCNRRIPSSTALWIVSPFLTILYSQSITRISCRPRWISRCIGTGQNSQLVLRPRIEFRSHANLLSCQAKFLCARVPHGMA